MNRRTFSFSAPWSANALRRGMPCVGLIVFAGCLSFLVAPDDDFAPPQPQRGGAHASSTAPRTVAIAGPPTVIIDPGHGGIDDGTKYFGLAEKDLTLDVAQRLEPMLKGMGVQTVLTRRDDVYVSLPDRVEIANRLGESNSNVIFVSIHFNQSPSETVDGIETFYADQKIPESTDWTWLGIFDHPDDHRLDHGENLAADIQGALTSRMQVTNRGIKSRSLYVVRHTRMPAVLVEAGFLSDKVENQMLRNDAYRDRIAQGLAAGILVYTQTMHPEPPPRLASASY